MSNDFQAGSRIGDYILDSYIGGGSFGAVWRGHALSDPTPVAVKLLTGELAANDSNPNRADVEVLAAAAAGRSQHVVQVLGGGVKPVPYIVMELIEGTDLLAVLKAEGVLSPARTLEVGLALSDALRALNQVGIIHRDIKPANVMIDSRGVIKLADFGIAKIVGYATMTQAGQTAMTMAYAAPEIWDEDSLFGRPSHRSDLYALGILLYQCLTGATPFSGNYGALYKAHAEQEPDLRSLPAGTPPSLRILIRRCLEKRQERRPRDATECLTLLRRAEVELADASGSRSSEPKRLGPWLKESPHPSLPWAWRCRNERSGERATVEVHFADSLDYGSGLGRALAANATLAPLGAEKLIETNRLLLYPGESWQAAPPSEFQFWVAREDRNYVNAPLLSVASLRSAVPAIARLIEVAAVHGVTLDLAHDNLVIGESGGIYVRRPGLTGPDAGSEDSAFLAIASVPLDPSARQIVDASNSFRDLIARLSPLAAAPPTDDATQVVARRRVAPEATAVAPAAVAPNVLAPAAAVRPRPASLQNQPARGAVPPVVPPPPPVAAGGGSREGGGNSLPVFAAVGMVAAAAAVAIAAVVFASGGDSDNGGGLVDATSTPQVTVTAVSRTPPAVTPTLPAVTPTRPAVTPTQAPLTPTQPAATATAASATATPAVPRAEILGGVDKSNQVFITAFRNGNANLLPTVYSGEALAYFQGEMKKMLDANQRQENALLSSEVVDVQLVDATHATVKTRERWSYKVVGSPAAAIITNYDEVYELVRTNGVWIVSLNTFTKVP